MYQLSVSDRFLAMTPKFRSSFCWESMSLSRLVILWPEGISCVTTHRPNDMLVKVWNSQVENYVGITLATDERRKLLQSKQNL